MGKVIKKNKGKFLQGFFKPLNPQKYRGDPTQIIYRSGWELKAFTKLDLNPNVIQWGSEEIIIPYISKIDNRPHRYFTDLWVKMKLPNGLIKEYIMEIKPFKQTQAPKKPDVITKSYISEVETYAVNTSKWEAAKKFCEKKGWEFHIITEKELGIK